MPQKNARKPKTSKNTKGKSAMTQKDTNFFNINDMSQGIARTLTDGINTRIFPGKKSMISVVRIEPNATGAIHSHPQEQWGLMIEGSAIRIQDGEEIPVKKGDFWVSPGGVEHGVIGGPDGAVILDVFSPPRDEYMRPGSGFGEE
jgi:quercetin dioxygenase-like cupin family protein